MNKDDVQREEVRESAPTKAGKKKIPLWQELALLLFKLLLIVAVVGALFVFVFGVHRVDSTGMEPRFRGNDIVFYYRIVPEYSQSDVVVVNYKGKDYLGRIVASGGDVVEIDEQGLKVNGSYQSEGQYTTGKTQPLVDGVTFPLTVPEGSYFILGDNREEATDSRIYGAVPQDNIYGSSIIQIRRSDF